VTEKDVQTNATADAETQIQRLQSSQRMEHFRPDNFWTQSFRRRIKNRSRLDVLRMWTFSPLESLSALPADERPGPFHLESPLRRMCARRVGSFPDAAQ
jgi:hypothetical protein